MDSPRTYAEAYTIDAQQAAESLARDIIALADEIKVYADHFQRTLDQDSRQTPSSLAAQIVSVFTNGVGNCSTRLWSVVYGAGKAEFFRMQIGEDNERQ
jgi:predicted oxidoreductase (fatty acid repression mutant protein)